MGTTFQALPAAYIEALNRESAVRFSPDVLGPWSARGLRFSAGLVVRGEHWRDQTGTARFTALPGGHRMALRVAGNDLMPPDLDALAPGAVFAVSLPAPTPVLLPPGTDVWEAPADLVADSVYAVLADGGGSHEVASVVGRTVTVAAHPAAAVAVYSLRTLTMMVVGGWEWDEDEWAARAGWSISLEEV